MYICLRRDGMNTEKRTTRNLASAVSEKTCPPSSSVTRYFKANKKAISLPDSDAEYPKLKCKIPKFRDY